MLALVGGATMLCTPLAGRLVDRRGPDPVNLVCTLGVLVSAAVLAAGARGGALGLARNLVALYGRRPRLNEDPATSRC
ncbi:putative MFS family arabinose efflux permease [Streptosporangium album]|uniref:Putative MFS family arabinose efflux permease n=1 Tax=Streptosporangium album TaxID=47479 RepID=A0A7W7S3Z4_9ACTN|nr:hypothetical protein [Streptosporangium album]MBB4943479.1 putative MFS family arabinose efflux permease [Streptosporangium album]